MIKIARYSTFILLLLNIIFFSCIKERDAGRAKEFFAGYENIIPETVPETEVDRSELITIDIPSSKDQFLEFDELIDSLYYVKLETNSKCLIGNIDKIISIKDRLIIIERFNRQSVLMFSDKGEFLTEISKSGKGPGEYISLSDVAVDKNKEEIVLFDGRGRKRLFFDLDGKFLREEITYFYSTNFEILSNGNYLYAQLINVNMHLPTVSNYNLVVTTPDQIITQKIFRDEIETQLPNLKDFGNKHNLHATGAGVLFTPRFSDTIYEINSTGVKAKFHLNMGDRYVVRHMQSHNTVEDYFEKQNNDKLYKFNGVSFETDNSLFFNISNLGSCFYKKGTGELVWGNMFSFSSDKIIGSRMPEGSTGSFFIGVIWPHSLYIAGRKFEESVAQILEGVEKEDNPILFFYSIKD